MSAVAAAPTSPQPPQKRGQKVLLSVGKVHVTEQDMNTAADTFRGIGHSIEGAWKNLDTDVNSALKLPVLNSMSAQDKTNVLNTVVDAARGIGYGAAGVAAVAGVSRLRTKGARRFEGLASIAMAGAIATTVSGMVVPAMVLMPLAGALGIARGGINLIQGARNGNERETVGGVVDISRSVGTIATGLEPLESVASTLGEVALVCGVVGNAVQVVRGGIDLKNGLKVHDDRQEINGLTDIGMAVGGMVAATGVGAIPGFAIAASCVALKLGCIVCKPLRNKTYSVLDKHQAGLQKSVDAVGKVTDPIVHAGEYLIREISGHGKNAPDPAPTAAPAPAAAAPSAPAQA